MAASRLMAFLEAVREAARAAAPEGSVVVVEEERSAGEEVQRALGLGSGLVVVVGLESAGGASGQGGPVVLQARVRVLVMEAPELNRGETGTGRSALEVAEAVVAELMEGRHGLGCAVVELGEPTIRRQVVELNGITFGACEVRLVGQGIELAAVKEEVDLEIWMEDGQLQVAVMPEGARGFYSVDGSRPRVRTGTVWMGPVSVGPGVRVRCVGALAGHWESGTISLNS